MFSGKWEQVEVKEVANPALKTLEGKSVAQIAQERGTDGVDAFLDIAIEDDLNVQYIVAVFNTDEQQIQDLITDPRTMVGLSDGGAHVDMICDAGYCTYLLGTWARDKAVLSLEQAVKRITAEPADFFGLADRGRLTAGKAADIVLFDATTVGSGKRPEMRYDLPGGGRRLVMPVRGVEYTLVNGELLYQNGRHTEARPGQVLR